METRLKGKVPGMKDHAFLKSKSPGPTNLSTLEEVINNLRIWLPLQNPLPSFVHNNPIMHFEKYPFLQGLLKAASLYQARPFLSPREYFELAKSHNLDVDLKLNSTNVTNSPQAEEKNSYYKEIEKRLLHDALIPLISTFLDQGVGLWINPFCKDGLWSYFTSTLQNRPHFVQDWKDQIWIRHPQLLEKSPSQVILDELSNAKIEPEFWEDYLLNLLFSLKGWSGMVNKLEMEAHEAPIESPNIKLLEWTAVLISCKHALDEHMLHKFKTWLQGPQLGQLLFKAYNYDEEFKLHILVEKSLRQRRIQSLREFWTSNMNNSSELQEVTSPRDFQVVFCMDDREESMRRHLEAIFPQVETFGVAGFYNVDMWFLGINRPKALAQCPPVIKPSRFVKEVRLHASKASHAIDRPSSESSQLKEKWPFFWGQLALSSYYHSRTLLRGYFLSLAYGLLSYIPLIFKILFPSLVNRLRNILPVKPTKLILDGPGGYTVDEMGLIVARVLKSMGTLDERRLARYVLILGHGSTNTNNPFRQAYGCGACGGNGGFPNSRAFVIMCNNLSVRENLKTRGIHVPTGTTFIAGYHDTCSDDVFYEFPSGFSKEDYQKFKTLQQSLLDACKKNAFERCQNFASFDRKNNPLACFQHVKDRSRDLAQPRPEYGHCGISFCVIGRRKLTSGYNFDRSAFLVSYDPSVDPTGEILQDVILAVLPVGVNISYDYFFSRIDPDQYGSGSKLPLNITGALGVMTGSKSDLRIGMAKQMTEIHIPVRITVLVEATEQHLLKVCDGHPRIKRLLENEWFFLGRIDPETGLLSFWKGGDKWEMNS